MIDIDARRYPVFTYFDLMMVFLFGRLQFTIARHAETARPHGKLLAWSKILLVLVFLAAVFFLAMPALTKFLTPGMVVDLVFGFLFIVLSSLLSSKNKGCCLITVLSQSL